MLVNSFKKNFLSNDIINEIIGELCFSLGYEGSEASLAVLRDHYDLRKKDDNWPKVYSALSKLDFFNKELLNKILDDSLFYLNNPILINNGVRIIEIDSERRYPFHQEYVGIQNDKFLIYWIALHDVNSDEGGLRVCEDYSMTEFPHIINKIGYPILENQELWKSKSREITFASGDCIIFDRYMPHATANKISGRSRWSLIYRVGES